MIERVRRTERARRSEVRQPRALTLLDAVGDPHLFAPWFKKRSSWDAWFAFIAALFALDMTEQQLATYRQCTGRTDPPADAAKEAWLVIGRRGGKSSVMALVAVWIACFRDYRPFLAPGERATVMLIAADRRQAKLVLRYIEALLTRIPMLRSLITRETAEVFELANGVDIAVATASLKTVRGYTLVAIIADEIAFWSVDDGSANPDHEIISALRPGLATIPGSLLLAASSPYARKGELWNAHRRHYGKNGDPILVWQADTRTMNPSVPSRVIDEAYEREPANASAEFGAQFRTDIEQFVSRDVVEASVIDGRYELPPASGITYYGFADPSGGAADSFTLAIGHRDGDKAILDAVRETKPPFSPDAVITEYAKVLKTYRITKITGDRFGGEFPRELFRTHGITYEPAAKPKSDLYREMLPVLNSSRAELLDNDRLVSQLCGLERRTARGGRDTIDHAPRAHDDLANAVAGVVSLIAGRKLYDLSWVTDDPERFGSYLDRMMLRQRLSGGLF